MKTTTEAEAAEIIRLLAAESGIRTRVDDITVTLAEEEPRTLAAYVTPDSRAYSRLKNLREYKTGNNC